MSCGIYSAVGDIGGVGGVLTDRENATRSCVARGADTGIGILENNAIRGFKTQLCRRKQIYVGGRLAGGATGGVGRALGLLSERVPRLFPVP